MTCRLKARPSRVLAIVYGHERRHNVCEILRRADGNEATLSDGERAVRGAPRCKLVRPKQRENGECAFENILGVGNATFERHQIEFKLDSVTKLVKSDQVELFETTRFEVESDEDEHKSKLHFKYKNDERRRERDRLFSSIFWQRISSVFWRESPKITNKKTISVLPSFNIPLTRFRLERGLRRR